MAVSQATGGGLYSVRVAFLNQTALGYLSSTGAMNSPYYTAAPSGANGGNGTTLNPAMYSVELLIGGWPPNAQAQGDMITGQAWESSAPALLR
ncbi:MAG: hypothetical protein M1321_01010 [Candidatus Marsarchaeota archaeon]|nr:hypothetical protein [Candidatus Marsarchaeota archaeon]